MRVKRDRLLLSKVLILLGFFISTGLPFVFSRRIFLPAQVNFITGVLVSLAFIILWKELLFFKRDWLSWTFASGVCFLALLRKGSIPPLIFKTYDLLFIFIAFYLVYRPSRINRLFFFSACLIAPLSLAEVYGLVPKTYLSLFLILLGFFLSMILPVLVPLLSVNKPRPLEVGLCIFLAILFGISSFLMVTFLKGSPKSKRVLFDIGHGTTESPLLDYDKDITGSAVFGHGRLLSLLENHGFACGLINEITSDAISGSSILVLIMPSEPYSGNEIRVIQEFVSQGGGLLAIGDHTDISHVLSCLNPVIERFGIRLRFDTLWLQENDRKNLCYRPHPATFDLERVNFSVGASLDIISPARSVILSKYAVFSDIGDPNNAQNAYLGNSHLDPWERINDLCLVADSIYGKGRVFVLGDSAFFQNTSIAQNWGFAYRLFDWLNHKNERPGRNSIILMMIFFLMGVILSFIAYKRAFPPFLWPLLILFLILSIWLGGFYNLKRFPMPEKKFSSILVDMAHQNEYTMYWINREQTDTSIDGMIGQIIRTGLFPVLHTKGSVTMEKLSDHKALFIICPNVPFSDKEIEVITRFVEEGGGLLLLDGPRKRAVSNGLWERFGLRRDRYPLSVNRPILSPFGLPIRLQFGNFRAQFTPHPITDGISVINMVNPCKVQGGFPIAFIEGIPVICFMEFGDGRIVAIGDDRFFANHMTEFQEEVIDADKLRLIWNMVHYLTYE